MREIPAFRKKILAYYKEQGRDLPWRNTTNPYHILVSEIMLQQTQVDRVIPFYTSWIKRWKTAKSLAKADRREVLKQWMGLGYNNRAIRLQNAAQVIVKEYKGDVLKGMEDHKNVPGVGPYTSSAVRIFSGNQDIVAVDTNIRRILIHEFKLSESVSDAELQDLAEKCLPKGKSRDWHNALMDYGAMLMTARKTGIAPKTKQSVFEGSDRQIRARIVRMLLKEEQMTLQQLREKTKTEPERLERILLTLIRDELINQKNQHYFLTQ